MSAESARVLVTGSEGFIGGYLVAELLEAGYQVVGLDNLSKYGDVERGHHGHSRYSFVEGDAKDEGLLDDLLVECQHFVAGAAMIGGISYFHTYAYDLIAENERITAASFDAAIRAHDKGKLRKITVLSSSMVFENAQQFPTPEGHERECPPPSSTYGFQKLAIEYFARGAWQQHGLPYTIIRPFNCVGTGELRAKYPGQASSGGLELAMSHVVPDLVQKTLKGQDPLHILGDGSQIRHYTYGGDLAEGIRTCIEHPSALNEDFNLSTSESKTVLEVAEMIWTRIHGPEKQFRWVSDEPYPHDVQKRSPDVQKARRLLDFTASTDLGHVLDEVIPWVEKQIAQGRM